MGLCILRIWVTLTTGFRQLDHDGLDYFRILVVAFVVVGGGDEDDDDEKEEEREEEEETAIKIDVFWLIVLMNWRSNQFETKHATVL